MRLNIELLDIVQHSQPGLSDISLMQTVEALDAREGGFMSYNPSFKECAKMPSGLMREEHIRKVIFDSRDWVQRSIVEVALAMNQFLSSGVERWVPVGRKPIRVLNGLWVKPSIRGILIRDKSAAPTLVVTRRSIELGFEDVLPFLMRGGYEFHLRDDPNFHDFVVLDLSHGESGAARRVREFRLSDVGMMSLSEFEHILSTYGQAASLSKYGLQIPTGTSMTDLFRAPRP